jgi:hypothetical protein
MIIGYALLIGGIGLLGSGLLLAVFALTTVGAAWTLVGIANVAMSRRARSESGAIPGAYVRIDADDLADPAVRARRSRGTTGALGRGLTALACAGVALGTGIWAPGFDSATEPWRIAMIVAGAVVFFLCLLGLLVYAASSRTRSAAFPATVEVLAMKETPLHDSGRLPYIRFVLGVYGEGLPYYEATIQQPVPALTLSKLAVGAQFSAMVAGPEKSGNVIVDWREPIASPAVQPAATRADPAAAATPAHRSASDSAARLRELDSLQQQGLISADEYQTQRGRILDEI